MCMYIYVCIYVCVYCIDCIRVQVYSNIHISLGTYFSSIHDAIYLLALIFLSLRG